MFLQVGIEHKKREELPRADGSTVCCSQAGRKTFAVDTKLLFWFVWRKTKSLCRILSYTAELTRKQWHKVEQNVARKNNKKRLEQCPVSQIHQAEGVTR